MKFSVTSALLVMTTIAMPVLANFEIRLTPDGPAESRFHENYQSREEARSNLKKICAHFPNHKIVLRDTATEEEETFSCGEHQTDEADEQAPAHSH